MSNQSKHFVLLCFNAVDANAGSSPFSTGVPAIVSQSGFVDKLRHVIGSNINITGFASSYYEPKLHGFDCDGVHIGYAASMSMPICSTERDSKGPLDMAPPTHPRISANFQLVIEVTGGDSSTSVGYIRQAMRRHDLRFCGGTILTHKYYACKPIESVADLHRGYFLVDATHKIAETRKAHPDFTGLEALYWITHTRHPSRKDLFGEKGRGVRFFPNSLGYVSLQEAPMIKYADVFGEQPHVFAEQSVGIVYEINDKRLKELEMNFEDLMNRLVFRKSFDTHGSMYLKQSKPLFPTI